MCPPAAPEEEEEEEVEVAPLELLMLRFASEDFSGFDFLGGGFGANGSV